MRRKKTTTEYRRNYTPEQRAVALSCLQSEQGRKAPGRFHAVTGDAPVTRLEN